MFFADYQQYLDPLQRRQHSLSPVWSTILAALPVLVLFWLLVPRRWLASKAGAAGAVVAILLAILAYGMPADMAVMAFVQGAGFGLLPVGWTIFSAMLLYNITVETGHFAIVRRSVAGLSGDARIQAVLIGFAFGAFLEGAAGGGTPVAICGAIMVGLGFHPFLAAVLCLIANTSPVAYGGLGTPLIVLSGVTTDLPTETLSVMAGHQLPFLSFFVPLYMVKVMCSWKQTWEVWPVLLVAGGSFALFQYTFATAHLHFGDAVSDDGHRRRHLFVGGDGDLPALLEAAQGLALRSTHHAGSNRANPGRETARCPRGRGGSAPRRRQRNQKGQRGSI